MRNAHPGNLRISSHFLIDRDGYSDQVGEEHDAVNGPGQFAPFEVEAQREDHRHRQNQDRPAFEHVGEGVGVLQRMGRVDAEIAAAIGAELLDRYDCRGGSL